LRLVAIIVLALLLVGPLAGTFMIDSADAQDEVPPVVMGVRVLNVGEEWFEVKWETNEPTKGGVEWGRTDEYGNTAQALGSFETVHYLNVTGLKKGTLYHFRVFAEDLGGNIGHGDDVKVGTFPYEAEDEGISSWTWAIIAIVLIVLIIYFLFRRPSAG
jgi:hypothetical protein